MTEWRTKMGRKPRSGPEFFWPGLLLLLPVAVLATLGAFSLRQDRLMLENEARERAGAFAQAQARRLWDRLSVPPGGGSSSPPEPTEGSAFRPPELRVSAAGELLFPPAWPPVPEPRVLDVTQLNAAQASLWARLEAAQAGLTAATHAEGDGRAFLATQPPVAFQAAAHLRLGRALAKTNPALAAREFQTVVAHFSELTGETGLPLLPLAQLGVIETMPSVAPTNGAIAFLALATQLASNAVVQPAVLSPWILSRLMEEETRRCGKAERVSFWQTAWAQAENHRRVFRSVSRAWSGVAATNGSHHGWPPVLWFRHAPGAASPPPGQWLVLARRRLEDQSTWYIYRDPAQWGALLRELISAEKALPHYWGVFYTVGGRTFTGGQSGRLNRDGDGAPAAAALPRDLLGTASLEAEPGLAPVVVSVALIDPAAFYARQRQRVFWFGALIAASAGVALLGVFTTRSALRRQRRLYQMQTDFVSSVTHELRAPIGAVRLLAENLKDGKVPAPAEQRRFHDYIVQECGRLAAMIENALNLARIEQGREEYRFEPADAAALVADTVRLLAPAAREKNATLRVAPPLVEAGDFTAVLDAAAIRRVLVNLIDNAIKHAPADTEVTVSLAFVDRAGGRALRFTVADRGPGIPKADHERIFERFYRRGSELRRETQGVGIGLSIVKHIVDAHQGVIRVESELGKGSRFVVELPASPAP
jgi:signal transduction histidine kinase